MLNRKIKSFIAYTFVVFFQIPFTKRFYLFINKNIFRKFSVFSGLELIIKVRNEVLINAELSDWIPQQLFFFGNYEEFELRFIDQYLEEGDTFIDIGANIGLYSLSASKKVRNKGNIIAFEPFYKNYVSLQHNVSLNNCSNIRIEKMAISNRIGTVDLFYTDSLDNKGMVTSSYEHYNKVDSIPSISLDEYVSINKIENIKYVKIDIEGGEYKALLGMEEVLRNKRPILQLEIDDNILAKVPIKRSEIYRFLDNVSYEEFNPTIHSNLDKQIVKSFSNSKNRFFRSINL